MIDYNFPLYRPPAEANSLIIQVTYGCSYNHCSFCSMYKSKNFEARTLEVIFKEIDTLKISDPHITKVFLADGDALCLETDHLVQILKYLANSFARLRRVSVYATAQNLLEKTEEELQLLKTHKLSLIYFGIETGNEVLLKKITKGVNSEQIIKALNKASKADIKTSTTVILGLGGTAFTQDHIKDTAHIINQTTVTYLSTLQLGLDEDIKQKFLGHFENFKMLNDEEILQEQMRFITLLDPKNKVIFRSNHASNALHLAGTFPKDKKRLLDELHKALKRGKEALVPKFLRGF